MKPLHTNWLLFGIFFVFLVAFLFPQKGIAQTQNFDGTFPPAGFSAPVGTGSTDEGQVRWYRSDTIIVTNPGGANNGLEPGNGGTGHCAVFDSYDINLDGKADLVMDNVDLSVYAHAELRFYLRNTSGTDVIRVYARNASDAYVQYGASSYGVYPTWTTIVIDLTALSGGGNTAVDIRFEGTSDWGVSNIGLDDISVAEFVPSPPGSFDGTFPPTGFSAPVSAGTADQGEVRWYRSDTAIVTDFGNSGLEPGRGGIGHCAVFNTNDIHTIGGGKADLIMDNVDLSGYVNANLHFYLKNFDGTDSIRVFARNGANAYVQYGASSYGVYVDWTEIVIDLTALSGGANTTVDIRFEATSDYGFSNIGLDDVSITGTLLPVELSTFTATALHLDAHLSWTTATETNNYGFEVERRIVSDVPTAINWGNIGFVAGAGTSNAPHDYSFVDGNVAPGRYAYRLKQIDKDGRFKYEGQIEVEVGLAPKKFILGQNYPNPFNPSTTIEFTLLENGLTTLKIYDMLGREVATLFHGEAESGRYYQVTFSARGGSSIGGNGKELASGLYFSVLESGGKQLIKKMLLLK